MTTKKKPDQDSRSAAAPAKKRTVKRPRVSAGSDAGRARTAREPAARERPAAGVNAKRRAAPRPGAPRIRASHGAVPDAPGSAARRPLPAIRVDTGGAALKHKAAGVRKAPLAGPKRTGGPSSRTRPDASADQGPSTQARELALALASAAIEKKAVGIEILDVTGKVDYADFLLVMTGRSDRHVHAIATGIEEEMRRRKHPPLSMEGLSAGVWVLIDFGDVVVHVFQEESRSLYDIEGLWIDAGRVPVPDQEAAAMSERSRQPPSGGSTSDA